MANDARPAENAWPDACARFERCTANAYCQACRKCGLSPQRHRPAPSDRGDD